MQYWEQVGGESGRIEENKTGIKGLPPKQLQCWGYLPLIKLGCRRDAGVTGGA
jgi:hypothetical protein